MDSRTFAARNHGQRIAAYSKSTFQHLLAFSSVHRTALAGAAAHHNCRVAFIQAVVHNETQILFVALRVERTVLLKRGNADYADAMQLFVEFPGCHFH